MAVCLGKIEDHNAQDSTIATALELHIYSKIDSGDLLDSRQLLAITKWTS